MAMATATSGAILSQPQIESLVILPLVAQSIAAQCSQVVHITSHSLRVPP